MSSKKKVIIIGAGPAGLSAAYEILKRSKDYEVTILEESNQVGGISKTINYKNNRMDLGGHRFFSKSKEVNNFWNSIMPIQNKPSFDDKLLNINKVLPTKGANPEKADNVMLIRNRVSRIYYKNKFFDYPISINFSTIKNLGFIDTLYSGFSYLKSLIFKKKEDNLENFYINRFGKKLYSMFFEGYTEKLWGRHPKEIDASWGAQRVKGISIRLLIKNYLDKIFHIHNTNKETSLIESFYYPKYGPGQFYEELSKKILNMGGNLVLNSKVTKIKKKNNKIVSVYVNNKEYKIDILISSMPIKDLVENMNEVPSKILNIATNLPYRDFVTVGLLVKKLNLKNETNIKTLNNIIPDCWLYVQDVKVKLGRIQVFNNWSPYMVKDTNNVWLGLEYFCTEGDSFWNLSEKECATMAIEELVKMKVINKEDVIDYHREKVKKAYPAYFDSYKDIDVLKDYLNNIDNLYCIGRNGQHRYNNMDHSILTAFRTVDCIINNIEDKSRIWNVNTEKEYHEEVK